eukprot:g13820.t2
MHQDARRLAQALAREVPEAAHLHAIRDACSSTTPSSPDVLDKLLETSAFLLLCPEQTVRVARAVGPLLLESVARALSAARASASAATSSSTKASTIASSAAATSPAERAEDVLVALSRLLPLAPHALPLALQHWRSSPCPFDSLTSAAAVAAAAASAPASASSSASAASSAGSSNIDDEDSARLRKRVHAIAEAAHKLLSCAAVSPSIAGLWNWSPFFHLCRHPDALVRWRAVGVCASLLGLDEQGRRRLLAAAGGLDLAAREQRPALAGAAAAVEGEWEAILNAGLDLAEDLRRAPSALLPWPPLPPSSSEHKNEANDSKSAAAAATGEPDQIQDATPTASTTSCHHHASVADIGGILHAKTAPVMSSSSSSSSSSSGGNRRPRGGGRGRGRGPTRLVPTASARRNLSALSLALAVDRPILLHGPAGAGKSLLAREAARLISAGNDEDTEASSPPLLELHLDDQTDSKSLLGAHACTDVPGEFAWRPGALTRAAAAGTWVLIEDLDRAPFEVLAAIGPLLEGRPLALPGRSRPLRAAPGFRVFGTVTTVGAGRVVLGGAADFGALWTHVHVEPLSVPETLHVAKSSYPGLPSPALKRLLRTMITARGGFGLPSRSGAGREPGVRDFLKLCARVETLGVFDGQGEGELPMEGDAEDNDNAQDEDLECQDKWFCSEAQALPVVVESLDVFAAHLTSKEALAHAAEVVAGLWNVLPSRAVEMATTSRPELVQGQDYLKIGRVTLPRLPQMRSGVSSSSSFAPTSHALRIMETLAASTRACEPVLLVGETGCGKTALVQRLAEGTGRELVVQNLSLQTDGADLLGGFRPVELRQLAQEVLEEFLRLFLLLFSATQNARFCQAITSSFERRQWNRLSKGLRNAAKMAIDKLDRSRSEHHPEEGSSDSGRQSQRSNKAVRASAAGGLTSPSGQRRNWERFSTNADRFERQRVAVEGSFAFSFVEGVLVKAIREGKWVLLDEINLASAETLQRLAGLLEGAEGSLCLTERGDIDPVVRHKDFRLFAAMNPPTDASKKDLPPALRRRFSEVYVPELEDRLDLKQVVDGYISGVAVDHESLAFTAVDLYLWARGLSSDSLSDGAGQRPRYSLRTLVGAVSSARRLVERGFSPKRAIIEGYRAAFETQLDGDGRAKILKGILRAFGKGMAAKDLEKPPRRPGGRGASAAPWVRIGPFWLEGGPLDPVDAAQLDPNTKQRRFVLTPSVEGTLRCLARAVASADSPVLLQGPTSAGKTSIVEYLAARLGHRCVRINNHEHTDIQEYTGSYAADGNGKLAFQEGVLVESLRKGYWIILDELNLAPSEVLEALNRLLDHNRELYLSETQETIKPHPNFRLFATQNPPGAYGGRKPLSRAFRNRFMEVHVDDIPGVEWEVILAERCGLPPSHCTLLVKVLHELQAQRQSSRLFLGKHSAISPRDLLRWAGRKPQGKQQLAEEGYMLLAERLRSEEEKAAMRVVLEEQIGVLLDPTCLYGTSPPLSQQQYEQDELRSASNSLSDASAGGSAVNEEDLGSLSQLSVVEAMLDRGLGLEAGLQGVAMTRHMRRLFRLSGRCLSHMEPLLLVGATGCGKTTVCQLFSMLLNRRMHVVNCHQNTEAADLLGGLRPLRGRDVLVQELRDRARSFVQRCIDSAGAIVHEDQDQPRLHPSAGGRSPLDTMDVVELTAAVQAAYLKLQQARQNQHAARDEAKADTERSGAAPATSTPAQKRARPSEGEGPEDTTRGGDVQADVDTAKPEPSTGCGRRGKGSGRAKRRKSVVAHTAPETSNGTPMPASSAVTMVVSDTYGGGLHGDHIDSVLEAELASLKALAVRTKGLFEWVDGPLITAMRNGEMILLDELSLAEDAVLERLNSVLEPGRSITLAEKGGEGAVGGQGAAETVVAAPGFRVVATMNPGGDFGKRELSPALRSRFTEIWVPALSDREDMEGVVQKAFRFGNLDLPNSRENLSQMAGPMLDFAWWFNNTASPSLGRGHGLSLSVRDLLSWAGFMTSSGLRLRPWEAYVHGAALVLLDGMGLGAGLSPQSVARLRKGCAKTLKDQIPACPEQSAALAQLDRDGGSEAESPLALDFVVREAAAAAGGAEMGDEVVFEFGVGPFFTPCGPLRALGPGSGELDFSVQAPTTSKNLYRVLRALQVRKAVLLEGSPGVGKTSLVSALAAATGHELVRINLSEQTDVSDLFGSDLPVPDADEDADPAQGGQGGGGGPGARFAWCDGVFLSALKAGKWVLLDELNLATQSVLEGLNACLDHRAEVYIPELGRSFPCPPTFKVFAAQNPLGQGGGRKGLPRSFLSRFTKVFVDPLTPGDLLHIAAHKFPLLAASDEASTSAPSSTSSSLLSRMIAFNSTVQQDTMGTCRYGRRGSPWEFNLRDVFRWCEVMVREQQPLSSSSSTSVSSTLVVDTATWEPWLLVDSLYIQRMRTRADRDAVLARFREAFPEAFQEQSSGNLSPETRVDVSGAVHHEVGGSGIGTHPMLRMTPDWMQVGSTVLPRGCWANPASRYGGGAGEVAPGLTMPLALRRPLQALARCVAMGWPALVVGHRGSGKTSIIQGLAAGVGARLTEVAMTPSVDVTELLGCFEQTDASSAQDALLEALQVVSEQACRCLLLCSASDGIPSSASPGAGASVTTCADVWSAFHTVRRAYGGSMAAGQAQGGREKAVGFDAQGMVAVDHLLALLKSVAPASSPSSTSSEVAAAAATTAATTTAAPPDDVSVRRQLDRAVALAETVRRQMVPMVDGSRKRADGDDVAGTAGARARKKRPACFCWSDGVLVEALERGDWVVLDGANLCSSSVLDRLNPLLEPGGVLPLTECGTSPDDVDDNTNNLSGVADAESARDRENGASTARATSSHRVIRPHPNFRLFLTADPSCGEVSRAMRNRCVEVCLLDAAPAVTVVAASSDGCRVASPVPADRHGRGATTLATTEHVADLLSLVRAAGLRDPSEATAAVATHCALVARRLKGRAKSSAGEGPASRSLLLWAELAAASRARFLVQEGDRDVLRRCMPLAYPGLSPGVGSAAEVKIARATLVACLGGTAPSIPGLAMEDLLESLVCCGWKDIVDDSAAGRVEQGSKLFKIVTAASGTLSAGVEGAALGLLSLVVDGPYAESGTLNIPSAASDSGMEPGDAALLHTVGEAYSSNSANVSARLVAQAAALFARRSSAVDRHLRSVSAARVSSPPVLLGVSSFERSALAGGLSEAVSRMMETLFDSSAWREASAMLSEMLSEINAELVGGGHDERIASVGQAALFVGNRWSPADPRSNPDLFRSLRRACRESVHWAPWGLLLRLVDASIGRRLPLLLAERAELTEARTRISSGRGGEAGLGWLGVSCLICEGGRDSSRVGGDARCPETRLARSALAPYVLPLLRAVDGVVEGLVCRQATEFAVAEHGGEAFLEAVQKVLNSRDTVSRLLVSSSSNNGMPGADASAGGVEPGGKGEFLFAWDPFLVSWRWLQQAVESLRLVLSTSSGLRNLPKVSSALVTLGAVGARVDAAVLQHAGGAEPTRDTLWKHGPRAAAPSSAAGAMSLARLCRLADEFRVLPVAGCTTSHGGAEAAVVSLGSLMLEAHPALSVSIDSDIRRELLHALCTLYWAASNEQADGPVGSMQSATATTVDLEPSARRDDSLTLAERLPGVFESTLKAARVRFESAHKGIRLAAVNRQEGLEHHQDDLEFGEKFDDFDTEAAEAVVNATLLVVSGDDVGAGGGDSAGGAGNKAAAGGVLRDWAVVQLSPLMEHWIAVEECEILSRLADLDVDVAAGSPEASAATQPGDCNVAALMARVARLRSAILATPSLSPAAARPHQTLLWAWADSNSWPDVHGPLLKRLLPVALDSFGRRLWENIVGTPRALSLQLAPPEMVAQSAADGGGQPEDTLGGSTADHGAFSGPMQLLTLARSSFLLRLLTVPAFRGGVVPGGVGGDRTTMDLTLMNASARLGQFRVAMRGVRDLAYGGGSSGGALKPLVQLCWARLRRTLGAFDELLATVTATASEGGAALPPTFASALGSSRSWDIVEGPLRSALEACPDDRLTAQAECLVAPAVRNLAHALEGLEGPDATGPTPLVESRAGLGMALVGCLRLVLLLPSSPVDPGLRPALKEQLLGERMEDVKGELTVRRWSLILDGEGDFSPEMVPLLRQARCLRDDRARLQLEAIERPERRPGFHALFRDVHAFARGVGSPGRVAALASSLARFVGVADKAAGGDARGKQETRGTDRDKAVDRAGLLQEEAVWQGAAGAFVSRCRVEYGEAYVDVVTGITEAVEVTRLGLRMLAAACASSPSFPSAKPDVAVSVHPLARLQGMLLSFPYPCTEGLTAVGGDGTQQGLGEALKLALRPAVLEPAAGAGAGTRGSSSGAQHVMLLQAVLSRAELLLSSGCSAQPALDAAVAAMEGAVTAWSRVEAEEAEKRAKEAEIIKYKMQEHVVESEEATNLVKLRALFPDYHSGFKDLITDSSDVIEHNGAVAVEPGDGPGGVDARTKALGAMSDKQLSSIVARHCRIFLSLAARRRSAVRALVASSSRRWDDGSHSLLAVVAARPRALCSDAERLAAFEDSYRASVLLVDPTSRLSSSVVLPSLERTGLEPGSAVVPLDPPDGDGGRRPRSTVLDVEEAFSASHLLALADAARLCKFGRSLLEDAGGGSVKETASAGAALSKKTKGKGSKKDTLRSVSCGVSDADAPWLGEGAAGRNLLLVDPLVKFHLDPNVGETRLADGPLAAVLRRVAGLLEEFPGHGVLIQLARVADRVRRMPLHSPLAAVLAGVELTLRKAQDWEQHAHRGVSLKDELRSLSALVVRWRAVELKSWPQLLDAREGAYVLKANSWWLHLYRLLTGKWGEDLGASNPLQLQSDSAATSEAAASTPQPAATNAFKAPDWPSARASSPDWLWSGLVSDGGSHKTAGVAVNDDDDAASSSSPGGFDAASLDHARGLFQPLDDFLRTSNVGEFFARLQMVRAFAAQLGPGSGSGSGSGSASSAAGGSALGTVLQGLWQYYSQFSEEVVSARSLVRSSIEKKLKEEAKLAKWDEQTYYSLAESSEKSHRKLCKLVSQYDEVLEVSVSEVLHRAMIAGIGERQEGNAPNPTPPCTEIPSLSSMFSVVKKVDSAADFADDDDDDDDGGDKPQATASAEAGSDAPPDATPLKQNRKRLTSKSTPAPGNSLEILDACLPEEPRTVVHSGGAGGGLAELSPWLRQALFAADGEQSSEAVLPLTARLGPLAQRMRSLLLKGVYARRRAGKRSSGGGWASGGRPKGFVGAGLAEELCLAVFGRIQALKAQGVGKQVKKRAVLDLLGGMRKQGLVYAKSITPSQSSDMLHVMALSQPFSEDRLAGFDIAWLFSGDGGRGRGGVKVAFGGKIPDSVAAEVLLKGERYYLRGVSELSRLRLEAGAPVSRDVTRREAEVMRGLAEHLGLLVLQQRGAATALETDLLYLVREVTALQSLTKDYFTIPPSSPSSSSPPSSLQGSAVPTDDQGQQQQEQHNRALPPQGPLRQALETEREGLLRGLEAIREVQLLLKSVVGSDPPTPLPASTPPDARLKKAKGGEGWGEAPIDPVIAAEVKSAIHGLERSLCETLGRVERYPSPAACAAASACALSEGGGVRGSVAPPLLAAGAVRVVVETREALRVGAADARGISERFAGVLPRAALVRVARHLADVDGSVGMVLDGSRLMRSWLLADASFAAGEGGGGAPSCSDAHQKLAAEHASKVGGRLADAVKAMLLSVQALCPRDTPATARAASASTPEKSRGVAEHGPGTVGDELEQEQEAEEDGWSTDTTLFEAHASAFEQARELKLWRCASAMAAARLALKDLSEDEAVGVSWCGSGGAAGEAAAALVSLCGEVLVLAEQVLSAGKAVLVGMLALNKGTAKLHYVTVRVFRTLLSKGLCSDETQEGEGEGDGDINGMKFDDDVEGTGMGEGEGKKDVTDQIEDEEQLLGLKGDEPDKDQAEEAKELGEDEQDKGMEMENDFEGEMFDVPRGDDKDQDKEEEGDEKEELDREMGDLGNNADVVDEKLWDEDDDDEEEEEGKEQGEEKFEAGSRLDGEKPEEDEIRTKEDGQDDEGGDKEGKEDDKADDKDAGKDKDKKDADGQDDGAKGQDGKDEEEGDGEGQEEGPVNDDLDDNYEDKPMGVEVRGEDEAMEVDEEGRDLEGEEEQDEDRDRDGKGEEEDMPDDMNLDKGEDDGGGEDGKDMEADGDTEDKNDGEIENEKEGFESLAPEDDPEGKGEELEEDEQQPQGSGNPGASDVDPIEEQAEDKKEEDNEAGDDGDDGDDTKEQDEDKTTAKGEDEPPAFGVQGEGGDSSVLEAAKEEEDGKPTENEKGEDEEQEKMEGQDGGGSAPDGRDDGGGGGQGDEGEGGEWRPDMSGGEGRGEGQGNDKRRRPDAPNPFRDPGDAMRHWHRRLDMLADKEKDGLNDDEGDGNQDDAGKQNEEGGDDGADGKFEYVTSHERGSSQVLGGVSEEQAAEAAHQKSEKAEDDDTAEKEVVRNGDQDGEADAAKDEDGLEAMEEENRQQVPKTNDDDGDGLQNDRAEDVDSKRKSGKQREKDGHREDGEDEQHEKENDDDDERNPNPSTDEAGKAKDTLDLDSLEEPPSGVDAEIVTNPFSGHQQQEEGGGGGGTGSDRQPSRGQEARLREELHALAEDLQRRKREHDHDLVEQDGLEGSRELWGRLRSVTGALSQRLCEQLRLVLEPMVATKLQGDYRSGKRINMRRVIPYIASGFRKDKIWLRRTKPAKRDYQVLMAIDDSESMADCGAGALALAAMTTVASGLTQLEAGQLAVARFGEDLDLLHDFGQPFTEEAGAKIVDGFTFDQQRTNTAHTLEGVVSLLEEARSGFSMSAGGIGTKGTPRQLVLLLSDGRFDRENKDRLRKLVREMNDRGQLLVLIVLDKEGDTSILKTREASYVNGKLVVNSYLDKYPFPLYILLNHIETLPETLADALRQWFELLQRQTT